MSGCLVPQDYRFSDDPPPFRNNPVTIVAPSPLGAGLTAYNGVGGTTACRLSFRVSSTDPDLDDPLTVRWYVDYDQDSNPGAYREELLQNLGSPIRGPVELTMDLGAPGNPLRPTGTHVLEVLVADGQLVNRAPIPRSEDPDAGVNPTFVDQHAWFIFTEQGDCP